MELKDVLQPIVNAAFTGKALSKAILEDYSKVVSKLTGDKPEDVIDRVTKRMEEISKEMKASLPKPE